MGLTKAEQRAQQVIAQKTTEGDLLPPGPSSCSLPFTPPPNHDDTTRITHDMTPPYLVDLGQDGDGWSASGRGRVEWDVTTAQEQLALLMNDEVFEKASPEVAFDMVTTDNTPCP